MFADREAHRLQVSQQFPDEIHLICPYCTYKRAVPLKIDGSFEKSPKTGYGIVVVAGDPQFGHVYKNINFDA